MCIVSLWLAIYRLFLIRNIIFGYSYLQICMSYVCTYVTCYLAIFCGLAEQMWIASIIAWGGHVWKITQMLFDYSHGYGMIAVRVYVRRCVLCCTMLPSYAVSWLAALQQSHHCSDSLGCHRRVVYENGCGCSGIQCTNLRIVFICTNVE